MFLNSVKARMLEHLTREGKDCSYIQHDAQNFNELDFLWSLIWGILFRLTFLEAGF